MIGSFHSINLPFSSGLCRFTSSHRFFERQFMACAELYLVPHCSYFAIPGGNDRGSCIAIPPPAFDKEG